MKTLPVTAMTRNADYVRVYHHVNVDPETTLEDILRPGFWAHHVARLNVTDMVDVMTVDGSLDVQLRVTGKGVGYVEMRPLRIWTRDEQVIASPEKPVEALGDVPDGYVVGHTPKTLYRVLTKDPVIEISRNHKSKAEAINAAIAHAAKANGIAA